MIASSTYFIGNLQKVGFGRLIPKPGTLRYKGLALRPGKPPKPKDVDLCCCRSPGRKATWAWVKTPLSEFIEERSYLLLPV